LKHDFPILTVLWLDHSGSETNQPYSLEDIVDMCKPTERETTGYLVLETKQCLAVANTIEEDGTVTEIDFIIKRLIKKRSDK